MTSIPSFPHGESRLMKAALSLRRGGDAIKTRMMGEVQTDREMKRQDESSVGVFNAAAEKKGVCVDPMRHRWDVGGGTGEETKCRLERGRAEIRVADLERHLS